MWRHLSKFLTCEVPSTNSTLSLGRPRRTLRLLQNSIAKYDSLNQKHKHEKDAEWIREGYEDLNGFNAAAIEDKNENL